MKLLSFLLFFILNLLSYSDYLLTNSEIVTFYDTTRNEIRYIKGNLFKPIDISKIDILLENNKERINLKKHVIEIKKEKDIDILKIIYRIKDKKIRLSLIPSIVDKSNFYIKFDLLEGSFDREKISLNLTTQIDRKLLAIKNSEEDEYDNFNITSSLKKENYKINFYSKNNGKKFLLENSEIKLKKYNISYSIENLSKNREFFFKIRFDNKIENRDILEDLLVEEEKWKEKVIGRNIKDKALSSILQNLYLLSENILIPNKIAFEISEEKHSSKARLLYIEKLLKFPTNSNKILNEIIFRKSTLESIKLYKLLFKLIDIESYGISEKLFNSIIEPQVLSIVDMISENGELLGEEDNIEVYYELYKLVCLLENRHGFENEKEYILESKEKLKKYINEFYLKNNKIKTRRYTEEYALKNIQYIDIFDIKDKKLYLLDFFNRYFDKNYGLLFIERDYLDIDFNLTMINLFYDYGLLEEAEIMFNGINNLVEKNQGYIMPKYYIYSKNIIGIYGDTIYLYLKAYKNRGKILEKR